MIGTLCIMDDKPRSKFTDEQSVLLQLFATSAANSLEVFFLRKKKDSFDSTCCITCRMSCGHQSTAS